MHIHDQCASSMEDLLLLGNPDEDMSLSFDKQVKADLDVQSSLQTNLNAEMRDMIVGLVSQQDSSGVMVKVHPYMPSDIPSDFMPCNPVDSCIYQFQPTSICDEVLRYMFYTCNYNIHNRNTQLVPLDAFFSIQSMLLTQGGDTIYIQFRNTFQMMQGFLKHLHIPQVMPRFDTYENTIVNIPNIALLMLEDKYTIPADHMNPQVLAATTGSYDLLRIFYDWNPDLLNHVQISAHTPSTRTPLYCVAACGCRQSVEFLIERNADVNQSIIIHDSLSYTPQSISCAYNFVYIAERLIEAKAQVNDGGYMLSAAVYEQQQEVVQLLLKNGCNPNNTSRQGNTCLMTSLFFGLQNQIILDLLRYRADVNVVNTYRDTALHLAISDRRRAIIDKVFRRTKHKLCLQYNGDGYTPLQLACSTNNIPLIVKLLHKHKANPLQPTKHEETLLHVLISNDRNGYHSEVFLHFLHRYTNAKCNIEAFSRKTKIYNHIPTSIQLE